jgi:hypothetical protein
MMMVEAVHIISIYIYICLFVVTKFGIISSLLLLL